MEIHHIHDVAVQAAKTAAELILSDSDKQKSVDYKGKTDLVTYTDKKSEQLICTIINETFPDHGILAEESKSHLPNANYQWVIDPLDGTSDFVSKSGEFTIMIALVDKHEPILGVIYWPTNDILYLAQKDCGAYKFVNDVWEKLTISNRLELHNCRALGSRHHLSSHEVDFLKLLNVEKFSERGSSLKVTDICSGTAELYFTMTNKIKQWDTCASYCLIKEAGGNITDIFGNNLEYNTEIVNHQNGIMITNGLVHNLLIDSYRKFMST